MLVGTFYCIDLHNVELMSILRDSSKNAISRYLLFPQCGLARCGWCWADINDSVLPVVLQKVPSEANPKVRNHGEGPY